MIYLVERKKGDKWEPIHQGDRNSEMIKKDAQFLQKEMSALWPDEKYRVAKYKRAEESK